jgi:YfiH family protein
MEILRSRLLEAFPHGFTTRSGGVSPPPWDALNLGGAVGDDPERVALNWERLRVAVGLRFARARQVHGDRIITATEPHDPREDADAIATAQSGVAACVSVADCVPLLLADPRSGAVVAVHAGWRGTLAGIASTAVAFLSERFGADPGEVLAAVGPSIGPCCYEVDPALAARFAAAFGPAVANDSRAQPRLDLWMANERALGAAGLRPAHVDVLGKCTSCDPDRFYSHRRDRGQTGRQVGYIAPPRPSLP